MANLHANNLIATDIWLNNVHFWFVEPEAYSLTDVAKLYRGTRLKDAMDRIENFSSVDRKKGSEDMQGPVEADPEYLLIVEANNLAAQIDEEIGKIDMLYLTSCRFYKFLRAKLCI